MTTTIKVRCCGSLHRISVLDNGKIVLHDHTRQNLRDLCVALTGRQGRGLRVQGYWAEVELQPDSAPCRFVQWKYPSSIE